MSHNCCRALVFLRKYLFLCASCLRMNIKIDKSRHLHLFTYFTESSHRSTWSVCSTVTSLGCYLVRNRIIGFRIPISFDEAVCSMLRHLTFISLQVGSWRRGTSRCSLRDTSRGTLRDTSRCRVFLQDNGRAIQLFIDVLSFIELQSLPTHWLRSLVLDVFAPPAKQVPPLSHCTLNRFNLWLIADSLELLYHIYHIFITCFSLPVSPIFLVFPQDNPR